ncbi:HD-GYP domain-containing protein [Solibacillus sp. FSL H8-0538]|uniref:HD-GYP domain-containing protein n=1 Tax=Solibacillus sp. FSL H8-0538 TaxID=2921400 RepID=UPI0030FAF1E3
MEATFVRVAELRLGKVVAEDIFANTQYPIVYKNTKINHEHLQVFDAFRIASILVYDEGETKNSLEDNAVPLPTTVQLPKLNSFEKHYSDAIQQVKKEFSNWQAGAKVDITKVRGMMIPLIEKVLEDRSYIFDLNSYSNPKDYLYHHCIATGLISSIMTQKLGHERGIAIQMAIAGMLADSGMAKIPLRIREKKESLTQQEFAEVRRHPYYSHLMVKDLTALKDTMKEAIFQHHERLDGSGYPNGNKIGDISNFSQIIAVADVFHAMTSERLYRSKQSPFKVIEMIKESEFGKFDIKVVQALIDIVVDLPIGTKIELSNLERGEVMFINKYAPTRPLVKLTRTGEIVDLSSTRSFYISRVITKEY